MKNNSTSKDRRFKVPRLWSNVELRKIAHLFSGEVLNASGWKDIDKEGKTYQEYFTKASSYSVSNHPSLPKGYQQRENELLIDLEEDVPPELINKFSVVLNHTVLEHVYDFQKAAQNLCAMSSDVIITVVPFMQQMHGFYDEGGYGDYWRFTPVSLQKIFERHGFKTIYVTYNDQENASVYVFHVCSKFPERWQDKMPKSIPHKDSSKMIDGYAAFIGSNMIVKTAAAGKSVLQRIKKMM